MCLPLHVAKALQRQNPFAHGDGITAFGQTPLSTPTACIYGSTRGTRVRKGRQQKAKTGTSGVGLVSTGDAEDLDAEVAVESLPMLKQFQRGRTSASATPTRDMLIFGGTQVTWMRI
ncbi:hypothetical protein DFH08DRAFT_813036 [Mycena albidolilacea]|uniref:Uncharacterized protein n=1 Tax=Mycena albidolilacea TaxID=1033008 RepID=A0AAD6ZTA8_9AGAR|nr:hypothetical protein DFH08DRAFT_813036 [Mycena albidolilacea]